MKHAYSTFKKKKKKKLKNKYNGEALLKREAFPRTAKSYNVQDFERIWKKLDNINKDIQPYLF